MTKNTKIGLEDCLIVGAGPVGLAAAQALSLNGFSCTLCGELPHDTPEAPDLRTAALFDGSIRMLERLGAWSRLLDEAAPIDAIRIVDATGDLLRAPEQLFRAQDLGWDHLGFNIANPTLVRVLLDCLRNPSAEAAGANLVVATKVESIAVHADHVTARLADGTTLAARLAIAADGRRSITRTSAGIGVEQWQYDQSAITAHIEHALPNDAISTEVHARTGPCTIVPLSPYRASLVWIETHAEARRLAALDDASFATALEERLQSALGPIRKTTPRRIFPLASMIADRFGASRVALVGESAHAFPPIGAQGLNLGLRDVADLIDALVEARETGADLGGEQVLARFDRSRRPDVAARTYGVDILGRSLGAGVTGLLRGAVLHATHASPGFKGWLMQRGLRPPGDWPTMMQ